MRSTKQPKSESPAIFRYSNYRDYLKVHVEMLLSEGESFRSIAQLCKFSSPNYIQQVISHNKNLSVQGAIKIADGLSLNKIEREYFLNLVKLDNHRFKNKEEILSRLRSITINNSRKKIEDVSIHANWLFGVIFELASLKNFALTVENVKAKIGHIASEQEIENSIKFLKSKNWIVPVEPDQHIYQQNNVEFQPLDDIRRIDLQRSHLRFIDLAKHRINDDLSEREFQGLTVAIPKDELPMIKERIRSFFRELRHELNANVNLDNVIRIQLCLYRLTRDFKTD